MSMCFSVLVVRSMMICYVCDPNCLAEHVDSCLVVDGKLSLFDSLVIAL